MASVTFVSAIAGLNWRARPGETREMSDDEAANLVRAGVARYAIEAAIAPAAENAALQTERPKGRGKR